MSEKQPCKRCNEKGRISVAMRGSDWCRDCWTAWWNGIVSLSESQRAIARARRAANLVGSAKEERMAHRGKDPRPDG